MDCALHPPAADADVPTMPLGEACGAVRAGTHAFFLDVDGSLIDLAPHPDAVVVPERLPLLLATLAEQAGGAVALVSGRTVASLDGLFRPFSFAAAGSHGAQLRLEPGGPVRCARPLDAALAGAVKAAVAVFEGVFAEDKGTAIAVHYRAAPEAGPALGRLLSRLVASRDDVHVLPGHRVFEVKPAGLDKGTAVADLMARPPFAGRVPLFIGDDVTDEDAFRAVAARGGLALAVGVPRPGAHAVFPDPRSVRAFLTHLAAVPRQARR